jgi:hypothetical protein
MVRESVGLKPDGAHRRVNSETRILPSCTVNLPPVVTMPLYVPHSRYNDTSALFASVSSPIHVMLLFVMNRSVFLWLC